MSRRNHHRYQIRWPVVLHHEGEQHTCHSRDMGLGGLFLCTSADLAHGARVELELLLPAMSRPTRIAATVRWRGPDGYGVQFRGLTLRALDTWALNRLLRSAHAAPMSTTPPPMFR